MWRLRSFGRSPGPRCRSGSAWAERFWSASTSSASRSAATDSATASALASADVERLTERSSETVGPAMLVDTLADMLADASPSPELEVETAAISWLGVGSGRRELLIAMSSTPASRSARSPSGSCASPRSRPP